VDGPWDDDTEKPRERWEVGVQTRIRAAFQATCGRVDPQREVSEPFLTDANRQAGDACLELLELRDVHGNHPVAETLDQLGRLWGG
jgi:hypothetical protein